MSDRICNMEQLNKKMKTPMPVNAYNEEATTYYVEIMSECNLKCVMCGFGSREIFQRETGKMDMNLFKRIIDKIAHNSPHATVSPYHHCEPMLHPQLPEMVSIIKEHNLKCELSFNFNYVNRLEDLLRARPDVIDISVSGYTQEVYGKNHIGGQIERVKQNLRLLREKMEYTQIYPIVNIVYHMYIDNLGEDYDMMKQFTEELGFRFRPCWSRSISLEMSLKYMRERGYSRYKGETVQWFDDIPKLTEAYNNGIDRMIHLPNDYICGEWENVWFDECILNNHVVNIRWNGKLSLCSCVFDDRFSMYDYLDTPIENLWELRKTSLICKECLANNYMFYTNYYDMDSIDEIARGRLPKELAYDRRFFADNGMGMNEIIIFCKQYKAIYIYGAGNYGKQMAKLLEKNGTVFQKFVVSDNNRIPKDTCNVISMDDLSKENVEIKDIGLIVAMDMNHQYEVKKVLKDKLYNVVYASGRLFC